MLTDTEIKNRRDDILEEIRSIRRLKRGQLTEQTPRRRAADGTIQERGPYHIVQRWANGRNCSQRVPAERLAEVREAINGYQKLKALTEEFAELTETLTERSGPLLPAKKNSSRQPAKKSSPKPKPSSKSRPGA
jgi:hypothetical protein